MSTVYRILAILADRNVLHCFHRDGQMAYRLCVSPRHDHLMCRCCGRVQEHRGGQMPEWVTRLAAEEGFAVDDYQTEVVGLCAVYRPDPTASSHRGAYPVTRERP